MLDQLFGSKTRVKLLTLFYNNVDRPYYVREITRKIDEQINSVRRELQNLLSIGILKSVSRSNRLYYEVDPGFKFFKQFEQIFQNLDQTDATDDKLNKEEEKITRMIRRTGNVKLLFLSGSFVRGSRQMIDIFVVGDVNKTQLANSVEMLEQDMNRELNYTAMRIEDFDYRRNLNDRFLTDILDSKKIVLIDELGLYHKSVGIKDQSEEDSSERDQG
ncbi:transcriptional regulator [Candidatus Nomurabacteria bacterium]|nr:transcriptional regulator [Candidatus Nomurabacteria bacterium]